MRPTSTGQAVAQGPTTALAATNAATIHARPMSIGSARAAVRLMDTRAKGSRRARRGSISKTRAQPPKACARRAATPPAAPARTERALAVQRTTVSSATNALTSSARTARPIEQVLVAVPTTVSNATRALALPA